jgi:hypothetical protein
LINLFFGLLIELLTPFPDLSVVNRQRRKHRLYYLHLHGSLAADKEGSKRKRTYTRIYFHFPLFKEKKRKEKKRKNE